MESGLGALIREIRLSLGINQESFSAVVGAKRNTISQYENGLSPSLEVLIRLYARTPASELRERLKKHIMHRLKGEFPKHPDLLEGLLEGLETQEVIVSRAGTVAPSARKRFEEFAAYVTGMVNHPEMLDDSIVEMLELWYKFGWNDAELRPFFRDSVRYIRMHLDLLADKKPEKQGGRPAAEALQSKPRRKIKPFPAE